MKTLCRFASAAPLLGLLAFAAPAADDKVDLKVGDPAPAFSAKDDQGKDWNSADVVGKKVLVVYFYPADLTRGCTNQACGFRDDMKKLTDKGVEVVGVSGDSVENHQLFKKEKELNFTLLADEQGEVAKKFGVRVGKGGVYNHTSPDGTKHALKRGVTIERWTFVIDKDGKIAHKDTQARPDQDPKKIQEVVEKLQK
jgi:peroxiredoxin Q/BCP